MKVKAALAIYIATQLIGIGAAWAASYFGAWWIGMTVLTILLIEHAWRVVRRILRNEGR